MGSTILRQWLVLTMLPRPPRRIDTASIEGRLRQRGIEVHRRTIQRDLLELAEVFPIIADERAKPYGWRWADDASAAPPFAARRVEGPSVSLTLRLPSGALPRALEGVGFADYHVLETAESYVTVRLTVEDSAETRRTIFGISDAVEVLAPPEWRAGIAERARRALGLHAASGPESPR